MTLVTSLPEAFVIPLVRGTFFPRLQRMRTLFTNQSAHKNLLLWLLGEAIVGVFLYAIASHLSDFAQVIILLVAVMVIWNDRPFPKTLLFWQGILGLTGLGRRIPWQHASERGRWELA